MVEYLSLGSCGLIIHEPLLRILKNIDMDPCLLLDLGKDHIRIPHLAESAGSVCSVSLNAIVLHDLA